MYGWRAKIGLVVPTNNTVIEPEFSRMAPDGVSVHAARILSSGLAVNAIENMVQNSHRAVEELRAGDVDVIGYACLATTLVKGPGWNAEFIRSSESAARRPVVTAADATVEALTSLNVKKIALATPYPDHINNLLPAVFEAAGLSIVSRRSVTVQNSLEVCRLPPWTAYQLARQADVPEAEAVCLLATDFPTVTVLEALENDLRKPVVSTNQALLWRALKALRISAAQNGFGSLLRQENFKASPR